MLVSELVEPHDCPHVQNFIESVLDMQFSDVRAMLQLPRPDVGITPGCNFAIVSTLCNLLSGISTTIYKPADLLHEVRSPCRSDRAFQGVVRDFFPYSPPGAVDFPGELYSYARNPLAHSVGMIDGPSPAVSFHRVLDRSHADRGWTDQELNDLESGQNTLDERPSITIDGHRWILCTDCFYLDVIRLLRRLTADVTQMQAAETRFQQGVYNWRRSRKQ